MTVEITMTGKVATAERPRLRILQAVAGKDWGGVSMMVQAIAKKLIAEGCEVTILSSPDATSVAEYSSTGARLAHSAHWRREISPLHDLLFLWEMFRLCRKHRFDVVHTHSSKTGMVGRIAAWLAGTPLVVHTIHGFSFHEFSSGLGTQFFITLEKIAAHFSHVMISVNSEDRETAIKRGITAPERIVTIVNGIDPGPLNGTAPTPLRAELQLPDEAILVGSIGRLAPQKGYTYLVEAVPALRARYPQAHVIIAGNGPEEEKLHELVKKMGLASHCHLLGFRRDIAGLLAAFDIFVTPSLWEGLSISLLEAMAAGKAIVSTAIKGNRETIQSGVNGLLVEAANPNALATAIGQLIEHPEQAQQLSQQARHSAETQFSEEKMVTEVAGLYRRWL
jgi:glycosyltransferase involved in cell wall biosynthesis